MDHAHKADDTDSSFTLGRILTYAALGTVVTATALIAAPHILPLLGVTESTVALEASEMIHSASGIAGGINTALASVPFIGESLAAGGLVNAAFTGIIGLGGVVLGDFITDHADDQETISWGRIIKYAALTTSAIIALPTVLSALSAGIIYCTIALADAGMIETANNVIASVAGSIGSVGGLEGGHAMMGASGIVAALPHFITCGASILPAALTFKIWRDDQKQETYVARNMQGKPLPADDPNHRMNTEEIALTDRYNKAAPMQKILLKKEILERGYDPDFHSDGTVHLYKHAPSTCCAAR